MKGVIYTRFSAGPNQTEQSIEGQISDCMAYAERNNITVLKIYADKAISGKSTVGRDQFLQMMEDASEHKFDCIIVWKIDRFGRNRQDIAMNKFKLKKYGVKLLYAAESIPDTPEGIILESIMEGMAEYYSADLSQKVSRGMRESAKKGKISWSATPIGYTHDEEGRIITDETTLPFVSEALKMYSNGAKQKEVIDYLNDNGVKSRRSGKISKGVLYRMVRNKAYLGTLTFMGIDVPIEAAIDEETWKALELRNNSEPNRNAKGTSKVNYLLSCKCYCGNCGALLNGTTGTSATGKPYYYYACGNRRRNKKCCAQLVRKEKLEAMVLAYIQTEIMNDEIVEDIIKRIMAIQEEEKKENPTEQLKKKLTALKGSQTNLVNAIANTGNLELVKKLDEVAAEIVEIEERIDKAAFDSEYVPEAAIRLWFDDLRSGDVTDIKFSQKLIDTFVERVDVAEHELTIHFRIISSRKLPSMECPYPWANLLEFHKPEFIGKRLYLRCAI